LILQTVKLALRDTTWMSIRTVEYVHKDASPVMTATNVKFV